ncbi:hypothetical protein Goklo_004365 [Gossypium klotzschianum]|uniref:Uncharacterized protein n=1 Tax=Gossypium klotzschianum TaxID=34286 RepID=A0A7J8VP19_9ROSI|nr:hypothetical protein [Gossypium klotzschianum]
METTRFDIEKFDEWEELDEKALSTFLFYLANRVLQEVLMEKTSSVL